MAADCDVTSQDPGSYSTSRTDNVALDGIPAHSNTGICSSLDFALHQNNGAISTQAHEIQTMPPDKEMGPSLNTLWNLSSKTGEEENICPPKNGSSQMIYSDELKYCPPSNYQMSEDENGAYSVIEAINIMSIYIKGNMANEKDHVKALNAASSMYQLPIKYKYLNYSLKNVLGPKNVYSCTLMIAGITVSEDIGRCPSEAAARAAEKAFELLLKPCLCIETNQFGVLCLKEFKHILNLSDLNIPAMDKNGMSQEREMNQAFNQIPSVSRPFETLNVHKRFDTPSESVPGNVKTKEFIQSVAPLPNSSQTFQTHNPRKDKAASCEFSNYGDQLKAIRNRIPAINANLLPSQNAQLLNSSSPEESNAEKVSAVVSDLIEAMDTLSCLISALNMSPKPQDQVVLPTGEPFDLKNQAGPLKSSHIQVPSNIRITHLACGEDGFSCGARPALLLYDKSAISNVSKASTKLTHAADFSQISIAFQLDVCEYDSKPGHSCQIFLGGKLACEAIARCKTDAQKWASEVLFAALKKNLYTVKVKKQNVDECPTVITRSQLLGCTEALGDDNIGYKMLKNMGWSGGAIDKDGRGIITPLMPDTNYSGRRGLGYENQQSVEHYFAERIDYIIREYASATTTNNLIFSGDFSTSEEEMIQSKAECFSMECNKKSTRNHRILLVVSRKLSAQDIFEILIAEGGSDSKYELIPPELGSQHKGSHICEKKVKSNHYID